MAMINCPYCNEKITSTSSSCIFCGKKLIQSDVSVGLSKANEEFQKKIQQNSSVTVKNPSTAPKKVKEKSVSNLFYSWMDSDPVYIKKNSRSKKLTSFISSLAAFGWAIAIIIPLLGAGGEDISDISGLAMIGLIVSLVASAGFFAYFCRFSFVPLYNVRMMVKDVRKKQINVNPSIKSLIDPFRSETKDKAIDNSFIPSFFTAMCLLKKKSIVPLIVETVVSNLFLLFIVAGMTTFTYGMAFISFEGWTSTCTFSMVLFGLGLLGKIVEIFVFKEIYRAKITKFLKKEYPVEYNTGL